MNKCMHLAGTEKPCDQDRMTEASVEAEHALGNALQQLAEAAGLSEWAGQVIATGRGTWFGGIELSPSINTTTGVSMDVQQMQPGLDRVLV
jgi:hypothetical protein